MSTRSCWPRSSASRCVGVATRGRGLHALGVPLDDGVEDRRRRVVVPSSAPLRSVFIRSPTGSAGPAGRGSARAPGWSGPPGSPLTADRDPLVLEGVVRQGRAAAEVVDGVNRSTLPLSRPNARISPVNCSMSFRSFRVSSFWSEVTLFSNSGRREEADLDRMEESQRSLASAILAYGLIRLSHWGGAATTPEERPRRTPRTAIAAKASRAVTATRTTQSGMSGDGLSGAGAGGGAGTGGGTGRPQVAHRSRVGPSGPPPGRNGRNACRLQGVRSEQPGQRGGSGPRRRRRR